MPGMLFRKNFERVNTIINHVYRLHKTVWTYTLCNVIHSKKEIFTAKKRYLMGTPEKQYMQRQTVSMEINFFPCAHKLARLRLKWSSLSACSSACPFITLIFHVKFHKHHFPLVPSVNETSKGYLYGQETYKTGENKSLNVFTTQIKAL